MYPEEIAHVARGYLGQLAGETIRWTVDKERKELEGLDSRAVATSLRTAVTDEDFYYRNEARQVKDELEAAYRELNAASACVAVSASTSATIYRAVMCRFLYIMWVKLSPVTWGEAAISASVRKQERI